MSWIGPAKSEYDPFSEDIRIFFINAPDYETDISWLRKKLKESRGNMYFTSGRANYHVYNNLEEEFRIAKERNDAVIHFLAGPLISVPGNGAEKRSQEGREDSNVAIRLAREGIIKLYPSQKRQRYHFRVFEDMGVTNVVEPHHLGVRSSGSWYFYDSKFEANHWKRLFEEAVGDKTPVIENFTDYFLFITDRESEELVKWARRMNLNVDDIDLETCREFWQELIRK